MNTTDYLRDNIRTISDWPVPGVQFRDTTPLLQNPKAFRVLIDLFIYRYMNQPIDVIAGIDARGFIVGSVIAYELNLGFIPIRKKGKLPYKTVEQAYDLEYSSSVMEMHTDSIKAGSRVLLVDDLIATGGTMLAGKKLIDQLGGTVTEGAAIIDLSYLNGSKMLNEHGLQTFSVLNYAQ